MNRWWAVLAAGLSVFMAALDMSALSVSLPVLGRTFAAPPSSVEWVLLAYSLPMVALILPAGRWADGVDRRRAFLVAVVGFSAASAAAGLAPSLGWLICARLVQGAFGSLISALVPAVAAGAVPARERGRAMGVIGSLGPLGSVAGPAVGGLLISVFGWRPIFFVNVPVGLLVAALAARALAGAGTPTAPRRAWAAEAALLGAGTLSCFAALHRAALRGAAPPAALGLLALAALAVVLWRRLPEARAVSDLLAVREFRGALAGLLLLATVGGTLYYLPPYFLQDVLRATPREIGFTVLAMPFAMGAVAPLGGYLADRWGNRPTSLLGAASASIGLALLLPLDPAWRPVDVAWRLGVIGLGTGLFAAPNQSAIMGAAPPGLAGTAGALSGAARNLGFAVGPAIATAIWAADGSGPDGMRATLSFTVAAAGLAGLAAAMARSVRGSDRGAAVADERDRAASSPAVQRSE